MNIYNTYIDDGEIHALSKEYGYALKFFLDNYSIQENYQIIAEIQRDFTQKYADYLMEFNKEKVMKVLMEHLIKGYDEDFKFIFRPAYIVNNIGDKATFSLKFKRAEKDNLDEKDDQV